MILSYRLLAVDPVRRQRLKIDIFDLLKNYLDSFLLAHDSRDHGAHLEAFV